MSCHFFCSSYTTFAHFDTLPLCSLSSNLLHSAEEALRLGLVLSVHPQADLLPAGTPDLLLTPN